MPSRRFWMMERQIDRIKAENDIRQLNLLNLTHPPKSEGLGRMVEEQFGRLTLEIGDKITLRRNVMVAPEPDAAAKFKKLTGKGNG